MNSPEELHELPVHCEGFYPFAISDMEAAEDEVMAAKSEESPEAFVGRQGAQETFIVLASIDFELGALDERVGNQIQQS